MEELQQLVRLIERKGRLPGSHLLNFSDEENLETKFYNFLKDNNSLEIEQVLNHLYNSTEKSNAFKMLKSRLRKKLFNQLNYLNFSSPDNELSLIGIELKCNKLLSETNILIRTATEHLAEKQVVKVLKTAREANLTKQIIEALEQYLAIAAYRNLSDKVYKIKSDLEKQYQVLNYEREANLLYRISLKEYKGGIASRGKYLDQLEQNVDKLKSLWEASNNSFIFSKYSFLKMMYLEFNGNYSAQIIFINEIREIYNRGGIHPLYYRENFFLYIHTYACLRCKYLEEGLIQAQKLNQLISSGVHNWFAHNENYFMLAMHSKYYDKAEEILNSITSHVSFKNINSQLKERWSIYAGLFQLVTNQNNSFKSSKDLKELHSDKKGFNIWILIYDFLTLLKNGNHELLIRDAERIRKYMSKHLDSKSDPRNKLFLKLLLLVVKEDFDLVRCRQKSRYLFNKLSQLVPAGDAYAEVEIVPFEHLWEFILNLLENQKASIVKH